MRIKKNQIAMFHVSDLGREALDFVVTHCNAVRIITNLEENLKFYDLNSSWLPRQPYMEKERKILDELKSKVDIFEKSGV